MFQHHKGKTGTEIKRSKESNRNKRNAEQNWPSFQFSYLNAWILIFRQCVIIFFIPIRVSIVFLILNFLIQKTYLVSQTSSSKVRKWTTFIWFVWFIYSIVLISPRMLIFFILKKQIPFQYFIYITLICYIAIVFTHNNINKYWHATHLRLHVHDRLIAFFFL